MRSHLKFHAAYLLVSFFLISCEPNLPSEEMENSTQEVQEIEETSKITQDEVTIKNEKEIYTGNLGDYQAQIVMQLSFSNEKITGTYYYTKHQKNLTLKGTIDYSSGKVILTESYKNKTTGYLEGKLVDNKISGDWKANINDENTQPFSVTVLESSTDNEIVEKKMFSTYINEHNIELYNSDTQDWELMSTTDILKVNNITNQNFDFYYSITGTNGHSGSIEGIGTMQTETIGQFKDGDGCELRFAFYSDSVSIEADGCENYAGARAYFGGTLIKK